jgi:uncharacterized protein YjiS (DUF1127 family)
MYFFGRFKSVRRSVGTARQRRALQSLSDHMLKDIGLSRSDIDGLSARLVEPRPDIARHSRGQ